MVELLKPWNFGKSIKDNWIEKLKLKQKFIISNRNISFQSLYMIPITVVLKLPKNLVKKNSISGESHSTSLESFRR